MLSTSTYKKALSNNLNKIVSDLEEKQIRRKAMVDAALITAGIAIGSVVCAFIGYFLLSAHADAVSKELLKHF